jgi:hypothetical protein
MALEYLNINYFVLIITLFFFIISSYEDLKKREVYDYYNFSYLLIILITGIFDSIYHASFYILSYVLVGIIVGFSLGSLLYYSGIWGGGDAKFMLGFGSSTYYIIQILNQNNFIFNNLIIKTENILNSTFNLFLTIFTKYILILDFIFFLIFFILGFILFYNKKELKERIFLISILFLLFFGLFYNLNSTLLLSVGFLAFILIFFAPEKTFESVYFAIPKFTKELKENEILVNNIKLKNNKKLFKEKEQFLITENIISILKENFEKNTEFLVKKIPPFGLLIGLNFIAYLLKIINLNVQNLKIITFNIGFILLSFIIGGIITSLIIIYFYIKNYKEIKITFSTIEKTALLLTTICIITTFILTKDKLFLYLIIIVLMIIFLKISKHVEKYSFVSKKEISKIVPGDWIVEDVKIDGKTIFRKEDFKIGIDYWQLEKIKELYQEKKIKELYVKDGIAFIPPMFITFIIILFLFL